MKRIFYISDNQLSVYHWQRRKNIAAYSFNLNPYGLNDFNTYLSSTNNITTRILLDLSHEDYKIENIPHVGITDRKHIISRLIDNHYRNNNHYVHSEVIGRERTGRKDDRLRITSLRNLASLDPWLDIIKSNETAISGLYSLPLLSPQIIKTLKIISPNVLLLSLQNSNNLRQTFIKSHKVIISRSISILKKHRTITQQIYDEIQQTHLFLKHDKHIDNDEVLSVHILYDSALYKTLDYNTLKEICIDSNPINYNFHNMAKLKKPPCITLNAQNNGWLIDFNFIQAYIPHPIITQTSHYGKPSTFSAFYTQLSAKIIYAFCTLIIISSFIIFLNTFGQLRTLNTEVNILNTRIKLINRDFEKTFSPYTNQLKQSQAMQSSILLVDAIHQLKSISPLSFMSNLSQALNPLNLNEIKINKIFWKQHPYLDIPQNNKPTDFDKTPQTDRDFLKSQYHYTKISGYILSSSNSFKDSLKKFNKLKAVINNHPSITQFKMIELPFDLQSDIESTRPKNQTKSRFEFEILMRDNKS